MASRPGSILATVALTLTALLLGAVVFIYSGAYNVAATEDHTPLMRWILNTTQTRSVAVRAEHVPDPPAMDASMLAHGFEHFSTMCVTCHGAPGVERGELGRGITPTPPELREAATEFSERELFWIIRHGIKMAGMPAFGPTHSDEEIWGMVGFIRQLPDMSEQDYAAWKAGHR